MEYKGYKIESIKNDGHLQRNAFGIYKNGKLISTATTSKEAQHEIDDIEKELKDMKTIDKLDKAIHTLDADIKLIKTVEKKNGYAIHIVEGGYGERIVLTFPGESYSNPHMWLGENNPSNMNKAKKVLNDFAK